MTNTIDPVDGPESAQARAAGPPPSDRRAGWVCGYVIVRLEHQAEMEASLDETVPDCEVSHVSLHEIALNGLTADDIQRLTDAYPDQFHQEDLGAAYTLDDYWDQGWAATEAEVLADFPDVEIRHYVETSFEFSSEKWSRKFESKLSSNPHLSYAKLWVVVD